MAPLNEQQLEQIHDERREQIKKAALKVFARHGINGTKMSMIAAEAGISQGLSYRYFSSKEELFTELVQEAMEEAQHSMKELGRMPGSPAEQIRVLTEAMLEGDNKDAFLLIHQAQTSSDVPERAKEMIGRYSPDDTIEQLVPILVKGQEAGEFREGDPRRLLFLYLSALTGLMLQEVPGQPDYWRQESGLLMGILLR